MFFEFIIFLKSFKSFILFFMILNVTPIYSQEKEPTPFAHKKENFQDQYQAENINSKIDISFEYVDGWMINLNRSFISKEKFKFGLKLGVGSRALSEIDDSEVDNSYASLGDLIPISSKNFSFFFNLIFSNKISI